MASLAGSLQLRLWQLGWKRLPRNTRSALLQASEYSRNNRAFTSLPSVRGGRRNTLPTTSVATTTPLTVTGAPPRRGFIFRFFEHQRLKALELEANQAAGDAMKQFRFLRELGRNYPEAVIHRYELGKYAVNEAVLKEYIKALTKVGRLDRVPLQATLEPLLGAEGTAAAATAGRAAGEGIVPKAAVASTGTMMGMDPAQPVFVTMVEPGFKQQLWKTFRFGLFVFLAISGLSALFDDRGGISSKLMMSTNLHVAESSDKRFADVMGVDEAKAELQEIVMYLKDPGKFTRLGGKLPKGLLLMGPPGTGKTLLARAIAGEAGVPFFYASGSEFEEMYVGVGARRVRDLFEAAKKRSPCIIFVDEIDAIGGARHLKDQQAMKMTLNQLLVELDGFEQNKGIIIIGATNFPQSLDEALLRPGRFDKHVNVPLPDINGRKQILEVYCKKTSIDPDVDLELLARGTPGMSGAELSNLVNQAAIKASVDGLKGINMQTFEWAKDKILMGSERRSAVISKETAKMTAFHEGGHALVALHTKGADPVYKATIMPRGQALGMVTQMPDGDQTSASKRQLMARLDVCMGGRVAEEVIFGAEEVTSGAASDIQQATRLAQAMVMQWGMSDHVGVVYHSKEDQSPETRAAIDREVKAILDASYERAKKLILGHRHELNLLAAALMEHETLSGAEIQEVIKGKKIKKRHVAPSTPNPPPPSNTSSSSTTPSPKNSIIGQRSPM